MASAVWKPRLIGRAPELAKLQSELRRAARGEFRCALVLGDPGVGKTRLGSELLARNRRGAVGLTARAYPMGETASYGVWVEALERHLRGLGPDEVRGLCGGFLDDLASLVRSVAVVRGSVPEREPPRIRLLEGLTSVVANLASSRPVVAVLDDVHLADASSWEALNYMARNVPEGRVLVVAAARPAELAEEEVATAVLLGLEQEDLLSRLPVAPLRPAEVRELTEAVLGGDSVPDSLPPWLFERSRGHPLFVLGLLQGLIDEGAELSAPELSTLPHELAERVGTRLKGLDEPTLAMLELLTVLGHRVEMGDLVRLAGRPLDRLGPILEALVRSRLVNEEERERELIYEIAHPLIQEAIYEGIGGARRRALHRLVARSLVGSSRLGEAASHFASSAEVGEAEAVEALVDAVHQAEAREAYQEGFKILSALLDVLPSGDERWVGVLDAMAHEAEWVVDHRADVDALIGIRVMREIEKVLEGSSDLARLATVKFRLASFLNWGAGDQEAGERACREALELFDRAGETRQAMIAAYELGWVRFLEDDLAGAEAAARKVLKRAEAAGDRFVQMECLGLIACSTYYRGLFWEAEPALRRGLALAREDGRLYRSTWNLSHMSFCLALEGRIEETPALLEEARAEDPNYRDSLLLEWEAGVRWLSGDFGVAVELARETAARNPGGLSLRRVWVMAVAAMSAAEMGAIHQARRYLKEATVAYRGARRYWSVQTGFTPHAAGLLAWMEGRLTESLEALQEQAAARLEAGLLPQAALVLVDLAEVAAEAGSPEAANWAATRLRRIAGKVDRDLYRSMASMGTAWARLASGRADLAVRPARQAVEWLVGSGYRPFHGRALDALGQALRDTDRAQAVHAFEAAAEVFESCGAVWRRNRVLAAMKHLGQRGRRAVGAARGPESLTSRERDVVILALQGLSAREIAKRLFIGERTVETHLAHAYPKLGVASKVELIRRAPELQL